MLKEFYSIFEIFKTLDKFAIFSLIFASTGTPPLTRFFGPGKNSVKGEPRYRRSILILKPQKGNLNFQSPLFEQNFTTYLSTQLIFKQKKL